MCLSSDITITEEINAKCHHFNNKGKIFFTMMSLLEMVKLLFSLEIKDFYRTIMGARNDVFSV